MDAGNFIDILTLDYFQIYYEKILKIRKLYSRHRFIFTYVN